MTMAIISCDLHAKNKKLREYLKSQNRITE